MVIVCPLAIPGELPGPALIPAPTRRNAAAVAERTMSVRWDPPGNGDNGSRRWTVRIGIPGPLEVRDEAGQLVAAGRPEAACTADPAGLGPGTHGHDGAAPTATPTPTTSSPTPTPTPTPDDQLGWLLRGGLSVQPGVRFGQRGALRRRQSGQPTSGITTRSRAVHRAPGTTTVLADTWRQATLRCPAPPSSPGSVLRARPSSLSWSVDAQVVVENRCYHDVF